MHELNDFLASWQATTEGNKEAFISLQQHLDQMEGVQLQFISRPGITYSLRAKHPAQQQRELFVMVDVIEDEPRWLSVCFYQDLVSDPDEQGDFVPGGLLGEDAICFDMETASEKRLAYIRDRIDEACIKARQG
ncbi:MAG: hypothetical protein GX087_09220 [Desulfobulbaceae bacterium]|nr:hypothetical protein [Desulfobulbaceae bacterium]